VVCAKWQPEDRLWQAAGVTKPLWSMQVIVLSLVVRAVPTLHAWARLIAAAAVAAFNMRTYAVHMYFRRQRGRAHSDETGHGWLHTFTSLKRVQPIILMYRSILSVDSPIPPGLHEQPSMLNVANLHVSFYLGDAIFIIDPVNKRISRPIALHVPDEATCHCCCGRAHVCCPRGTGERRL
jgi:hypothetical protein